MINNFYPFEEKYFNKKSIANKEEKKANTNIVKIETSTSPSWKDIKIFIKYHFFFSTLT